MMPRYYSQPERASLIDEEPTYQNPLLPYLEVPDHQAVHTGLLDARGDPIWRAPNPVGFHRWS